MAEGGIDVEVRAGGGGVTGKRSDGVAGWWGKRIDYDYDDDEDDEDDWNG
jgi:hypothetical protein